MCNKCDEAKKKAKEEILEKFKNDDDLFERTMRSAIIGEMMILKQSVDSAVMSNSSEKIDLKDQSIH